MMVTVTWNDVHKINSHKQEIVEVMDRADGSFFKGGVLNQAMRQNGYSEAEIHTQHYVGPVEFTISEKMPAKSHVFPEMVSPPHTIPKVTKVCTECASTDVVIDAWAEWDVEKQDWVLANTYESCFCNDCDGECNVEDKEIV